MGSWQVAGPVIGMGHSWRDKYPNLATKVEQLRAPTGRGIAWEGSKIWAYRDRPQNLVEVFRKNVQEIPDEEAYVFYPGETRITWAGIGEKVNSLASHLRHHYGFQKGDRMCLLSLGSLEYVVGYLATVTLGGIATPINLGLAPEGIAAQINKVQARGLIVSPEIWDTKVSPVKDRIGSVREIFMIGEAREGTVALTQLMEHMIADQVSETIDEWDLCAISFTSGTTGAPKGTMTMHINALGCAEALIDCQTLSPDDTVLCMAPLYHNTAVYANFIPALLTGARLIVMASFTPLEAIKLLEKERVTACVAAPVMLWMIMNHPEFHHYDCSTLKKVVFGGHAASEAFIHQLMQEFSPVAAINGGSVSESTALGFALPTDDALRKITSCGLATPNTEIALFDEEGREIIVPNQIGEVGYKGQQTNAGYWDEPQRTQETFRKDGYVLSGDWAKIDEDGYLWLLDRKKDMIVRGGQNVYCIEVENKIYLNDKVLGVAVVGVPDPVFAQRVKAVVVPKPGSQLSAQEIREHCIRHLAPYEVPEYVVLAQSLVANPAGKTLKARLVDFWGTVEKSDDVVREKMDAYCHSMPDKLRHLEILRLGKQRVTPIAALQEIKDHTELGMRLRQVVEEQGIVALLT